MIAFICGSMFGGFIGVMLMGLIIGGKGNECKEDESLDEYKNSDN